MARFSAYFDASGTRHDEYVFGVAGGVSTVDKWQRLEDEWRKLLRPYGLDILHMKTIRSDVPDKTDREELLLSLAQAVRRRVNKTIGQWTRMNHWRQTDRLYRLTECIGNPYPFCGLGCVGHLDEWAKRRKVRLEDIEIFFEDGDEHKGELKTLCKSQYGIDILFDGKECMPFQVGDLIAWSGRRDLKERWNDEHIMDQPWLGEVRKAADTPKQFSKDQLRELCDAYGVPRR